MQPGHDRGAERPPDSGAAPSKRPYVAPKLERLGTIQELTHGEGANNQFDGSHPPGQNKSII
jgi:hypothetical protein